MSRVGWSVPACSPCRCLRLAHKDPAGVFAAPRQQQHPPVCSCMPHVSHCGGGGAKGVSGPCRPARAARYDTLLMGQGPQARGGAAAAAAVCASSCKLADQRPAAPVTTASWCRACTTHAWLAAHPHPTRRLRWWCAGAWRPSCGAGCTPQRSSECGRQRPPARTCDGRVCKHVRCSVWSSKHGGSCAPLFCPAPALSLSMDTNLGHARCKALAGLPCPGCQDDTWGVHAHAHAHAHARARVPPHTGRCRCCAWRPPTPTPPHQLH